MGWITTVIPMEVTEKNCTPNHSGSIVATGQCSAANNSASLSESNTMVGAACQHNDAGSVDPEHFDSGVGPQRPRVCADRGGPSLLNLKSPKHESSLSRGAIAPSQKHMATTFDQHPKVKWIAIRDQSDYKISITITDSSDCNISSPCI